MRDSSQQADPPCVSSLPLVLDVVGSVGGHTYEALNVVLKVRDLGLSVSVSVVSLTTELPTELTGKLSTVVGQSA